VVKDDTTRSTHEEGRRANPGRALDDQEASPGGGAWNSNADRWGSPRRVQTELGGRDEKQLGDDSSYLFFFAFGSFSQ
jgi:hypothetical protein